MRHYYSPATEDVREDIKRSEDIDQTATNRTQIMKQFEPRGSVDALNQRARTKIIIGTSKHGGRSENHEKVSNNRNSTKTQTPSTHSHPPGTSPQGADTYHPWLLRMA